MLRSREPKQPTTLGKTTMPKRTVVELPPNLNRSSPHLPDGHAPRQVAPWKSPMTASVEGTLAVRPCAAAPPTCALEQALGRNAACPRHMCPLWEAGGTVIRPGCALSRTPLDLGRPGVADRLHSLRQRMQDPLSLEDAREAHREFRKMLAAAFDDDFE